MATVKDAAAAKPEAKKETPKKEPKPKRERINGIVRPAAGTATGKVWDFADTLSKKAGKPAQRAEVLAMCEDAGINPATAATQYGRWRKYHGLKGRGDGTEEKASDKK